MNRGAEGATARSMAGGVTTAGRESRRARRGGLIRKVAPIGVKKPRKLGFYQKQKKHNGRESGIGAKDV